MVLKDVESAAKEIVGIHIAKNDCCGYYCCCSGELFRCLIYWSLID